MPFRTACRSLLVATALAMISTGTFAQSASPAPAPAAEEEPVWIGRETDTGAALMFAVPHSDDIRLSIECDNKRKRTTLTVYDEIKGLKQGQPISIELTAGGQKASVKGVTTTDEMHGYIYGEARNIPLKAVLDVLRAAGVLSVRMAGTVATSPEKQRAGAVDTFKSLCKVK